MQASAGIAGPFILRSIPEAISKIVPPAVGLIRPWPRLRAHGRSMHRRGMLAVASRGGGIRYRTRFVLYPCPERFRSTS